MESNHIEPKYPFPAILLAWILYNIIFLFVNTISVIFY